jgi:dolichyldiphosphatase
MFGKGYGMPSSHAQFVAYFAVYLGLFLLFRHSPTPSQSVSPFHLLIRLALAVGLCVGASAVAISRIYLNYHTPKQVLAGCGAGIGCAFAWFLVTAFLRTHDWIDWTLDLTLSTRLRLRDLVVSEDLTEAGWQRWEEKRKLKRRGHTSSAHRFPKSD